MRVNRLRPKRHEVHQVINPNLEFCVLRTKVYRRKSFQRGYVPSAVMLIGLWETEAHATGLAVSGAYQEQMTKAPSIISGTGRRELYEVSLQV